MRERRGNNAGAPVMALMLAVAASAALASAPALFNRYFWDDRTLLERQLPAITGVRDAFFPPQGLTEWSSSYYRPIVTLSFLLDRAVWGENAFGYHLTVLLLHSLTAAAVYLLARSMITGSPGASRWGHEIGPLAAGGLFALHPVHAEAAAWISGRTDILATLFVLIALLASLVSVKPGRGLGLVLVAFASAAAVLSKEPAIVLPLLTWVVLWGSTGRGTWWRVHAATLAGMAASLGIRAIALGGFGRISTRAVEGSSGPAEIPGALAFAVRRLLIPWSWSGFHSTVAPPTAADLFSLTVLAALALAAWRTSRAGRSAVLFTCLSFLPILSPVLVNISSSPIADRYLYLASVGLCLMVGAVSARLWRRIETASPADGSAARPGPATVFRSPRLALIPALAIVAALALDNARAVSRYRDDATFWEASRRAAPGDGFVRLKWGEVLLSAGRPAEAQTELRDALRLTHVKSEMVMALDVFALAELRLDRPEEARRILDKVTAAAPGYMQGHLHLALAHRRLAIPRTRSGSEPDTDPLSLLSSEPAAGRIPARIAGAAPLREAAAPPSHGLIPQEGRRGGVPDEDGGQSGPSGPLPAVPNVHTYPLPSLGPRAMEELASALAEIEKALVLEPGNPDALLLRAGLALDLGRTAEAAGFLGKAIPAMPPGPRRTRAEEILRRLLQASREY